jgi:uncharacterized membrane protein
MKFMPNADSVNNKLRYLAIAMMLVSFLGFVDSTYLTVTRFMNASVPCTITHGCDTVLKSEYSVILGVPVVILGTLYYLAIFFGSYFFLEYQSRTYFKLTAALTVFGLIFSSWFVYVQLGILNAICQYCMLSALTSTVLFGLGLITFKISSPSPSPTVTGQE